jgi:hypothetical protein
MTTYMARFVSLNTLPIYDRPPFLSRDTNVLVVIVITVFPTYRRGIGDKSSHLSIHLTL